MAHERARHISELFSNLLGFSPIVGFFGHRQVGKSTFLAGNVKEYRTLDDYEELELAALDPKGFIGSFKNFPGAIDECQLEPKLFPTLKEWVRTKKRPGQFVLSGSVRFTSRQAIRESLAGRMAIVEMLPFSVREILQEPLSNTMNRLLDHRSFSNDSFHHLNPHKKVKIFLKHFDTYLTNGGLPGLCFIRSPKLQFNALNDLHDLILSRDLRLVSDLRVSLPTIKKLLNYISQNIFQPYNTSEVRRLLGLAPQTQRKLLEAMEAVFLIRRIQMSGKRKECFLLEDQLEELVYSANKSDSLRRAESAVYRNIRVQFFYTLDKAVRFESYLTRDHARVPIVIRGEKSVLGIIIIDTIKPSLSQIKSAGSFLKKEATSKIIFLSTQPVSPEVIDDRNLLCSIGSVI
jgi:hypothetical protein